MKKLALVLTVFTASVIGAKAQSTGEWKFGIGVDAALPIGNAKDFYKFGIGGQVQAEYGISEQLKGVATVGYTSFSGKSFDIGGGETIKAPSVGQIPILVGARFYPSELFFIGAQIGYGKFTGDGGGGGFEYRPQIGVNAGPIQIIGSYDGVSDNGTFSAIHLGAVYTFGGGK